MKMAEIKDWMVQINGAMIIRFLTLRLTFQAFEGLKSKLLVPIHLVHKEFPGLGGARQLPKLRPRRSWLPLVRRCYEKLSPKGTPVITPALRKRPDSVAPKHFQLLVKNKPKEMTVAIKSLQLSRYEAKVMMLYSYK